MRRIVVLALAIGLVSAHTPVIASVSEQEAKRLDGDLTPIGAERAGNAAGTIPAWDGGLRLPPPGIGFQPGGHHPDPFASDKPLYTVTRDNMAQYDALLAKGYKAMLEAFPESFVMNVFPTRRACAFSEYVYDALKRNAVNAKMINNENGVTGALMGAPFPIPQSAREILWNHELAYRGHTMRRETGSTTPTKSGSFNVDVSLDQWIFSYSDPAVKKLEDLKNINYYFLKQGLSPAANAGTIIVFNNTIDQVAEPRRVWNYRPGERRVKRAQNIQYDNIVPSGEGIRTSDAFQIFNGAGDRYEWQLIGKREMLIPYNAYRFVAPDLAFKDVLSSGHLNPDAMRYELHRVWVIEGKLKAGQKHAIAHRRRIYLDEDSWIAVAADIFGPDDRLARFQEAHILNYYDQPLCSISSDAVFDIAGGRYSIIGLRNQLKPIEFNVEIDQEQFSPEGMRRLGLR